MAKHKKYKIEALIRPPETRSKDANVLACVAGIQGEDGKTYTLRDLPDTLHDLMDNPAYMLMDNPAYMRTSGGRTFRLKRGGEPVLFSAWDLLCAARTPQGRDFWMAIDNAIIFQIQRRGHA